MILFNELCFVFICLILFVLMAVFNLLCVFFVFFIFLVFIFFFNFFNVLLIVNNKVFVLLCKLIFFLCCLFVLVFVLVFFIICLILLLDKFEEDLIVIVCFFWVFKFFVWIFIILFLLMLKFILICGILWGAVGIFVNWKWFNVLLLVVIGCLFCKMWILIVGWLLAVVENICDLFVGIVVLWLINFVNMLFIVLIFNDNGVMFNKIMFLILLVIILFWIAVFIVIILLGLIDLFGFLFVFLWIVLIIVGICVELLIRIILLILEGFNLVFFKVWCIGIFVCLIKLFVNLLNFVWVKFIFKCNGFVLLVVINGKLICVFVIFDKFFFVFLAVFFKCCNVILLLVKLILFFFLNFVIM